MSSLIFRFFEKIRFRTCKTNRGFAFTRTLRADISGLFRGEPEVGSQTGWGKNNSGIEKESMAMLKIAH